MQTTIGGPPSRISGGAAIGLGAASFLVASDFALVLWNHYPETLEGRSALALAGVLLLTMLHRGNLAALGLRIAPLQGWKYWARTTLLLGMLVGIGVCTAAGVWHLLGGKVPIYTIHPSDFFPAFLRMCVFVPVQEETIYRFILCVPLAATFGPWRTVFVSGLLFGSLHFAYGNPGPDNLIAGFVLAWAFLKSGSIVIPILLHSLGNLCVLMSWLIAGWQLAS